MEAGYKFVHIDAADGVQIPVSCLLTSGPVAARHASKLVHPVMATLTVGRVRNLYAP